MHLDADLQWPGYGAAIGVRLRWLRRHRGLSQLRLGELAGVSLNQVSNIERNVSSRGKTGDPHLSTLYRLARALDVPPVLLLPDAEQVPAGETTEAGVPSSVVEARLARMVAGLGDGARDGRGRAPR